MDEPTERRIATHLWVEAEIRRLGATGAGVYVLARGDRDSGIVIQKISDLSGKCRLLVQQRDESGRLRFLNALDADIVSEPVADAYIARARGRDPDLWVVEIEDRALGPGLSDP